MAAEILTYLLEKQHLIAYKQPDGPRLNDLHKEVIFKWASVIQGETVMDVGCGKGAAKDIWEECGYTWTGSLIGPDYANLKMSGADVHYVDMHGITGTYDVIYARHILEHSPFPTIALENWLSCSGWCIVVVPAKIQAIKPTGHLSVLSKEVWLKYFEFVGWDVVDYEYGETKNPHGLPQNDEHRWLLREAHI